MKDRARVKGREVIIEFIPVGAFMKVVAMDVRTLVEVSTQGPVNAPTSTLKENVIKRLEYVLRKKGIIES